MEKAPDWKNNAIARILDGLKDCGAWLDKEPTDPDDPDDWGYCVIVIPGGNPNGRDLLITRPTFDAPPGMLYQVDLGWEMDGSKMALFTDDGDVVRYVKSLGES
jgi:hypothetical protein